MNTKRKTTVEGEEEIQSGTKVTSQQMQICFRFVLNCHVSRYFFPTVASMSSLAPLIPLTVIFEGLTKTP